MGAKSTETVETAETPEVENPSEETPEETSEEAPTEAPEKPEDAPESDEQDEDEETSTLSHDDALKALKETRKEAAKYRTRLRETQEKFANAKTSEEVEAALAELKETMETEALDLIRENVALRYRLPNDVAATLSGKTKDELEAHAKVLARYISPNDGDPELQGGLDPDSDTSGSSHEDIRANVQRIRHARH